MDLGACFEVCRVLQVEGLTPSEDEQQLLTSAQQLIDPGFQNSRIRRLFDFDSPPTYKQFAPFVGPVHIAAEYQGKGRAVIADEDMPAGSLVIMEPPLVAAIGRKAGKRCERDVPGLLHETLRLLRENNSEQVVLLRSSLCCLHPWFQESKVRDEDLEFSSMAAPQLKDLPTGVAVADMYRMERVMIRNNFLVENIQTNEHGCAVHLFSSMLNHRCDI